MHVLQRLRRPAPVAGLPQLWRRTGPPTHPTTGQAGELPRIDRARVQAFRLRDNRLNSPNLPSHGSGTDTSILLIESLNFAYPDQSPLVTDWSAAISPGITLLYGDTGSGKSTLVRVMAGALPASGHLTLAGARLAGDRATYQRNVFFCDPATDAFDQLTARACTDLLIGGDARFSPARWQTLVDGFALAPHLDKPMYMLSTGSKRKVGLAAALASGRPMTLLDEPTGALDAASTRCLWRTLTDIAAQADRAIVIASSERIDQVPLMDTIELERL